MASYSIESLSASATCGGSWQAGVAPGKEAETLLMLADMSAKTRKAS